MNGVRFEKGAVTRWQSRLGEGQGAGGTLVALTPERPERMAATVESNHLAYPVLSDTTQAAAKAFKVYSVVDDETRVALTRIRLEVAQANSTGTWELRASHLCDRQGRNPSLGLC